MSTIKKAGHDRAAREQEIRREGRVQSVERALDLLQVLSDDEDGYRLTDLSERTGLSPSTVHRLLTTLEARKFVQFSQTDGLWHVGRSAFTVGSGFARQRNYVAPSLFFLRRLRDQTRETANLGIIDEGEVVVLTQVESREIMRAITRVGGRAPLAYSGMGKAILATYSPEQVDSHIERFGLRKLTPNSITRPKDLNHQLEEIRKLGYAVDDEEHVTGLRCVAAVVYDHRSEPQCAISVSGLPARMELARIPALGTLVADTARELTLVLGGTPPEKAV